MAELLAVERLSAGYGRAVVLSDVAFRLGEGEALAVLGRNGVGKTTLIDSLVGVTRRFAGSIALGGREVGTLAPETRAALGIGWVPQERNIFRSLSVQENITAVARPGPWTLERVFGLFPRLKERRKQPGGSLSGGEQQMLAIGRALATNPRLLLLDEPTEGLAPIIVQELLAALARLFREERLAAIIVEQHAQKILPITDRALILERGRIVHQSASAALLADSGPLDRFRSHCAVTRIFESFATFEKSFTGCHRYPNIGETALACKQCAGLEETMIDRMGAWPRRRVLAGMIGTTAVLGAPAILRAAPSGTPVKVGGTLSLTGFLAQTAVIHKIAAEMMVEEINGRNGFLGRPVEYVLLDDQSKPDVARSLYEKLITVDKVDLIQGPYATAPILAAMGVAQRYGKVIIQSSMGIPKLQTYDRAFPATPFGPEPDKTYPNVILDMMAAMPTPPKTMVVLTSKFPSAQFMAQGMRDQAEKRGVKVLLYLEYESGNRDFGAIAARVKEANPDFLWVGSLGLESNQVLESLRKLDYTPKNSFHLYPAPGPLALSPDGDKVLCSTFLEPDEPFMSRPGMKKLAAEFKEKATKANLPYSTIDAQACGMISEWQILEAAVSGAGSLEDEKIAAWLKKNRVTTIYGSLRFDGPFNHGDAAQLVKQVQNKEWKVVWPTEFAAPGVKLIAS